MVSIIPRFFIKNKVINNPMVTIREKVDTTREILWLEQNFTIVCFFTVVLYWPFKVNPPTEWNEWSLCKGCWNLLNCQNPGSPFNRPPTPWSIGPLSKWFSGTTPLQFGQYGFAGGVVEGGWKTCWWLYWPVLELVVVVCKGWLWLL